MGRSAVCCRVGRGLELEVGRGKRKKQILLAQYARRRRGPRCARHGGQARNDNSRGFRQALRRVEGGSIGAGRWVGRVGRVGWLARSRAEARPLHLKLPQLERRVDAMAGRRQIVEVGGIQAVCVRVWAGRGSRGWS